MDLGPPIPAACSRPHRRCGERHSLSFLFVSRCAGRRAPPHSSIVGSVIQHSAHGEREHGFAEGVLSKYVERPPDHCDRFPFIGATPLPFADSTRQRPRR
jgi:hypothetical protein